MKQSYSYTYACLHINTLSHVQIYKSTNILEIFPILIPYTLNVFSAQPPAPSRNGGGLLSVTALHIVPVTSLQAASRNGGGLLSVTALHIVPFTPLQARNGWSPTVGHGPSHRACHVTPSSVEGYYPSDGGLAVGWETWCRLVLVADAERNLLLAVRAILNFFLFLWLDQLLSFLVTEGPHHASAFPQGGPADVRHVVHLSIAQLARECPCSPRFAE